MEAEYILEINSQEIPVYTYTGEVVSAKKFSQTTVQGDANQIKSTVHSFNEVWLKFANGKEFRYVFPSGKVETREGQVLTLLVAKNDKIVAILNHNAQRYELMEDKSLFQIYPVKNSGCFFKLIVGVAISGGIIWGLNELKREYLYKNSFWVLSLAAIPAIIGIIRAFKSWNVELNEEKYIKEVLSPQITEVFEDVLRNSQLQSGQ